jgi:hypothetical protein
MSAEPVLAVENLSIRFRGHPVDLIDDVSFAIPAGKTLVPGGRIGLRQVGDLAGRHGSAAEALAQRDRRARSSFAAQTC